MEWFHNIPRNGILCECENKKGTDITIDVITRYNDCPTSDLKFRNKFKYYAYARPLSNEEVGTLIYRDMVNE